MTPYKSAVSTNNRKCFKGEELNAWGRVRDAAWPNISNPDLPGASGQPICLASQTQLTPVSHSPLAHENVGALALQWLDGGEMGEREARARR